MTDDLRTLAAEAIRELRGRYGPLGDGSLRSGCAGELADAVLAAVLPDHRRQSTEWLMPAHILRIVEDTRREHHRLEREARELEQAAIEAAQRGTTTDRTAEVYDLVRQVRDVLPAGRPDKLRYGLGRHRAPRAPAEPNPHFRGWATPPDLTDPAEHESA